VYDRGGIEPDIHITEEVFGNIAFALADKFLIFDYASYFCKTHPTIPPAGQFVVTDEIYDDFLNLIKGKEYDYKTQSEEALETLKVNAEKEKYFDAIKPEYDALKEKMMHDKQADLIKFKDQIKQLIKGYILPRYYYQKGRIEGSLSDDPYVQKAVEIFNNPDTYKGILQPTGK
jgi:carboxyl-terminal processing protease